MALRTRQSAGFTLLELLVAMSLMVVVAGSLYTALHTGFTARRSALAAVEPTSQAINAIELLKQDIVGVIPIDGALAESFVGSNSRSAKGEDADSVAFFTTQVYADDGELVGGVGKIELELQDDTDEDRENYRLVRKITRNLLSPKGIDPEEQVLCRNVTSLNLRYFDGDSWLDAWDSITDANSLPVAMEVEIQVAYEIGHGLGKQKTQMRRLVQSFAIPCGGAALTETESGATGTTGAQSPGQVGG